jgi:hypothetical protein
MKTIMRKSTNTEERASESKKKVHVKGYTTATGRVVPDHYRTTPDVADAPKGTFIERRQINPKRHRY